ncbi:hypothetical protein M413DRAFT_113070 [Hebeloma cylindrosporum]|uniref:F-box domain-containing protein n=1 Tax=Hebeloma cylindrosporum TaxID=76867 RepID=A0A0C3CZR3_HEBCY|nr:hypothetical protein M413DRAFT_113070 [Hebeloma cylindrosporum h7]
MSERKTSTIATILTLPIELLDEICSWAQQPPNGVSLPTLSLVSRQFCSLVQPRLLSHLKIAGFSAQLRRRPAQLKALSQGECAASKFAKCLTFDFTLSFPREDPAKVLSPIEIVMRKHLDAAIQSCKKVERIV